MATLSTGHAALLLISSDDTPCQGPPVATPQLPRNQAACASHHAKASGEGSPLPTPEDAEECWERQGTYREALCKLLYCHLCHSPGALTI